MATEQKLSPPYTSLVSTKSLVAHFAETTTPTKIDRGVLSSMAGGAQTSMISTLKFLKLIDENSTTLPVFRALVDAYSTGGDAWKSQLGAVIKEAYEPIVGTFDLERGTYKGLADLFQSYGVPQGQMLEKTVRFYWTAMQESGFKVSHFIANAKGKSQAAGRKPPSLKLPKEDPDDERFSGTPPPNDKPTKPPEGFIDQPVPLPGRVSPAIIRFPADMTPREWKHIAHAVEGLKLYAGVEEGGPP